MCPIEALKKITEVRPTHQQPIGILDDIIDMDNLSNQVIKKIQILRNLDFSEYRSETIKRMIQERMDALNLTNPDRYAKHLEENSTESDNLINTILINVSAFFRDPIVFELINQEILPQIIEQKDKKGLKEIRIWCAGCASGEEPYSMAVLIHQALKERHTDWTSYIFATDISQEILNTAEKGLYPREQLENVKLGILDNYFTTRGDMFEISPKIKRMVGFSLDDLLSEQLIAPAESIFGAFDMILCRNVLIYFNNNLQLRVITKLYRALAKKGYLILGDCESLPMDMKSKMHTVNHRNRIFQKKSTAILSGETNHEIPE